MQGAEEAGAELACAASGGRAHPVFGLWPVRLREDLRHAVVVEGVRKVDAWTGRYKLATVSFPDHPVDPFFNANRPDDLTAAAAIIAAGQIMLIPDWAKLGLQRQSIRSDGSQVVGVDAYPDAQ